VRYYAQLLALIASLFLLSCSSSEDNAEPPSPLTEIEQPLSVVIDWKTKTGAGIETASYNMRPLLVQNQIYSVNTEGLVKSIDTESGKVNWSAETDVAAITGLAGTAEVILASSRNGDLYAFNILQDGLQLRWSIQLKGEIRALPLIADQQVFVRTVDGRLSALSLGDGSILWTISRRVPALSLTGNSRPVVKGDLVIAGFDDGKISAFKRIDGRTVWETTVSQPTGRTEIERLVDIDGQFIVEDGIIYVSSYQGKLAAIQAIDGSVLWSRNFSSYQSIIADEDALYLSSDNSHIWSIDRRTGSAFWKQEALHARKITAPLLIGDKLVVADLEGYVHWLDKSDGILRGRAQPTDSRHIAQPLEWNNRVMVIDSEGILSSLYLKKSN
jgi:outer membrane protein assembly factor BamB